MVRVLWFLLFLFAYAIFAGLSSLFIRSDTVKKKALSFLYLETVCLLSSIALYVFVLILTRFSSILIAGYYFLSAQVYILVGMAFGIIRAGRNSTRHRAEVLWASACFLVRHIWLISAVMLIQSLLLAIGYPIVAGLIFFSGDSSTSVTLGIIRITLLILFVGGLAMALPVQIGVGLSENMSSATRRRFFAYSVVSILPTGVLLGTLLWTFSASVTKTARSSVSFRLTYSPLELSILVIYFISTFLLPYVIGVYRVSGQANDLQKRKADLLSKAIEILRIPQSDQYAPALAGLLSDVEEQFISFVRADQSVQFGLALDDDQAPDQRVGQSPPGELAPVGQIEGGGHDPAAAPAAAAPAAAAPAAAAPAAAASATVLAPEEERPAQGNILADNLAFAAVDKVFDPVNYRLARADDLRFQYIDWLDMLYGRLTSTAGDLQTKRAGTTRVNAARSWADSYAQTRNDLDRPAASTKANALAALVATTITTTLLTVFVTGFADWLWTQVAHTLPK